MAKKQVKESAPKLSSESSISTPRASKHRTARTKPVAAQQSEPAVPVAAVSHDDIAKLAYSYWMERGCEGGSPEEDWTRAERELAK
jgi:hypothetical protein